VHAAVGVFLGDRDDQPQVAADERILRALDLEQPTTDPGRPSTLLLAPQRRACEPVDGVRVELQAPQQRWGAQSGSEVIVRRIFCFDPSFRLT
jgi:hypothetical protein